MLNAKEISVGNLTYVLRSDESESHLDEVVELVEGSVDALRAKHPGLSMQNATLLAACDLASQLIRGRQQARAYQSAVLDRAGKLLEKVEKELVRKPK